MKYIKNFEDINESKTIDELKDTLKNQPNIALKFIWDWVIQKRINYNEFKELIEYVTHYSS
jgi:hypothetical protein